MQRNSSRLRTLITATAVLAFAYVAITWGRSWSRANHDVPGPDSGHTVWIATFNGL